MPSPLFESLGIDGPAPANQEPAREPRGMGGVAKDIGVSALKGAIAVPEAAVGVADLLTGGRAGRALEEIGFRPAEAKAILEEQYSPEQKEAFARVQAAQGFGDTLLEALRNPSVIGHSVVESLPSMGAGGVLARGAIAAAPGLAPVLAGAMGEGAVQAGSAAEQARQGSPDRLLSARGAGAAVLSGILDTAIAAGSGGLAKRLGIVDVDSLLAGAKTNPLVAKSLTKRVVEGMFTEGVLEELPQSVQEQVLANYGAGKPLDEGVNQAAVLGMLSGAAMGGGANVLAPAKVPETGPMSRAANQAQPAPPGATVAAAAGMEAPAGAGAPAQNASTPPGSGSTAEPQVDPVVERIKKMPAGDREEALAAYSMLSRDDIPKGVRQYNSRLLDDLLAKMDEKPAAESSDPAALLSQGIAADPLQQALHERGDEQAAQANLENWMARANPLPLQRAQEIQEAGAEQGHDLTIVPHAAGQGFTLIPSEWVTPAMRNQVASALPLATEPTGVLRADAAGNVAPETAAQGIDSRQAQAAQDAERARKNALGLTPDVEAVQAGKKREPLPTVQTGDVTLKTGQPFKNKGAALRAQKAAGGGEVVQVQGGWVVRTAAPAPAVQQELEAGDVGDAGATGAVASGTGGAVGDDASGGGARADGVGSAPGRGDVLAAAESGAVQAAAGEPAAAVGEATPPNTQASSPSSEAKPPKDATAASGERWTAADAPAREKLLLAAGWKSGSPGLEKMKTQAWDKMTQGQRNRIDKAMAQQAPESTDARDADLARGEGGVQPVPATPADTAVRDDAPAGEDLTPEAQRATEQLRKRRQTLVALRRCLGS